MRLSRRDFMTSASIGAGIGAAYVSGVIGFAFATAPESKNTKGYVVDAEANWTQEQKRNRKRLDRHFDRADFPANPTVRHAAFEALVVAYRESKISKAQSPPSNQESEALLKRASEWYSAQYPELPDIDWDKWLKILQWISVILSILFLFL